MEVTLAAPTLIVQTTYADLLERCTNAAFREDFAGDGAFVAKTIRGRRYWYFQSGAGAKRVQRYVGPETPDLLHRIERQKEIRDDERERRSLVTTLTRSYNLPRPVPEIGDIIAALAKAGVFRLRGVLVGTVAYQTYSAMLGVRLATASIQTGDVDIAQFRSISVAVEDSTPPVLAVLREVDKSFRAVPHIVDGRRVTSYAAKSGLRVDFLTPDQGAKTGSPQSLPALNTDAQPLQFLDFLIHEPEHAVILHKAGIAVLVPSPARYAVHKLIVSRRRAAGVAKRDKDLQQADVLLQILGQKRPDELRLAWQEAYARGPTWRALLDQGLASVGDVGRDWLLKIIDRRRSTILGLDLTFNSPPVSYDFSRDVAIFRGTALGHIVSCAISREALDDHFGTDGLDQKGRIETVLKHRSKVEELARAKYLSWPVEDPGAVLIRTNEVPQLLKEIILAPTSSSR
ncbi:MAG: DUF1488 family protein [Alphaproteobacteria bacterium]|nr:DUF1488 family protein [Alphaproteobacteria bacterium]